MLEHNQAWQSAIGSFLGLGPIFVAAILAFRVNKKRDEYLRRIEVQSIATALYAEIILLRNSATKMANLVARRYEDQGLGRLSGEPFDAHFFEMVPMPEGNIYNGLQSQIGKLPPNILLGIVQFYSSYGEARYWLPKMEEDEERGYSYGVLYVLQPALKAVEGIQTTLERIEELSEICPRTETPDLMQAKNVASWEEEQWAEIRSPRS